MRTCRSTPRPVYAGSDTLGVQVRSQGEHATRILFGCTLDRGRSGA